MTIISEGCVKCVDCDEPQYDRDLHELALAFQLRSFERGLCSGRRTLRHSSRAIHGC